MRHRLPTLILSAATGLMLLWQTDESGAQLLYETGPDAEVSADGLHKLNPAIMGAAWIRPGLDLSRYKRAYFVPTAIQFREISPRSYTSRTDSSQYAFPVSESRQAQLRKLFRESFRDYLSYSKSYELSDEIGRDVLAVQGILTDVISGVPPDVPGSSVSNVKSAWTVNIVLELRDSMSGQVLARTVERQRIDGPFFTGMVTVLTPRIVAGWSQLLVQRLKELSDLPLHGRAEPQE